MMQTQDSLELSCIDERFYLKDDEGTILSQAEGRAHWLQFYHEAASIIVQRSFYSQSVVCGKNLLYLVSLLHGNYLDLESLRLNPPTDFVCVPGFSTQDSNHEQVQVLLARSVVAFKSSYWQKIVSTMRTVTKPSPPKFDACTVADQRTDEWLSQRAKLLTASSFGMFLGFDDKGDVLSGLLQKIFERRGPMNCYAIWGTNLEGVLANAHCAERDYDFEERGLIVSSAVQGLGFSPDGFATPRGGGKTVLLEFKCLNYTKVSKSHNFTLLDPVRTKYFFQLQCSMMLAKMQGWSGFDRGELVWLSVDVKTQPPASPKSLPCDGLTDEQNHVLTNSWQFRPCAEDPSKTCAKFCTEMFATYNRPYVTLLDETGQRFAARFDKAADSMTLKGNPLQTLCEKSVFQPLSTFDDCGAEASNMSCQLKNHRVPRTEAKKFFSSYRLNSELAERNIKHLQFLYNNHFLRLTQMKQKGILRPSGIQHGLLQTLVQASLDQSEKDQIERD